MRSIGPSGAPTSLVPKGFLSLLYLGRGFCYARRGQVKQVPVILALSLLVPAAAHTADERGQQQRREREKLAELSEKLERRLAYADPTGEQRWLHSQAAALLERVRRVQSDRYRFDRVAGATDALLEASERIRQAREQDQRREDGRGDAARALQRDYFRVQQADYFAAQAKEENAAEFTRLARSLYQQARRAYDGGQYWRAETLGDAAGYVVRALEGLAQAAIRIPDPPRIP